MSIDLRPVVHVEHTIDSFNRVTGAFELFSDRSERVRIELFGKRGLVPISEIVYCLNWSNKLRVEDGEDVFNYPTGQAILSFLKTKLKKYQNIYDQNPTMASYSKKWEKSVGAIRIIDLSNFLAQFGKNPSRVEIIQALDNFVGKYLKNKAQS